MSRSPDRVLVPFSLLRKADTENHPLYAGNAAADVRHIDPAAGLFQVLSETRNPVTL